MKRNPFSRRVLLSTFFLLLSIFISDVGRAQWPPCPGCPTSVPPTTIGWTSGSYIVAIDLGCGTPCNVQVCYCYRATSSFAFDYTITQIAWPASCCPSSTLQQVIDNVWIDLLNRNPAGFPCPACPSTVDYYREVNALCWSTDVIFNQDLSNYMNVAKPCSSSDAWCLTKMNVCCDPVTGAKTFTWIESIIRGYCNNNCNQISCPQ